MTRALFSRFAAVGLLSCATFACQAAGPRQHALQSAADQRLSQREAPEQVTAILDLSAWSEEAGEAPGDALETEPGLIEETVVAVDEDTVEDSARVLRFVAVKKSGETLGVRVSFNDGTDGAEEGLFLGLRGADRIEEVDGLPVASVEALLQAWQRVGWLPEVRVSVSRGGHLHTVIYRRRTPGMAATW